MDYPVQLASQLPQLLKSLRKSRRMTQAELARRLGVVQSRVADIERNPGAVSVEQLLQVLAMLGAQVVVRDTAAWPTALTAGEPAPAAATLELASAAAGGLPADTQAQGVDRKLPPQGAAPRGEW
jgi:HTH-type transcriptional regulator/antitoxin HipB